MIFNLIKHAKQLLYDNSKSSLTATNTQEAIDEVNSNLLTTNAKIITPNTFSTVQALAIGENNTIPANGYVRVYFELAAVQWAHVVVMVNGVVVYRMQNTTADVGFSMAQMLPVKKGDLIAISKDDNTIIKDFYFYPQ